MTDLEKLIGDKQDQLRGRPRDWIDDFKDWRGRVDWGIVVRHVVVVRAIYSTRNFGLAMMMTFHKLYRCTGCGELCDDGIKDARGKWWHFDCCDHWYDPPPRPFDPVSVVVWAVVIPTMTLLWIAAIGWMLFVA